MKQEYGDRPEDLYQWFVEDNLLTKTDGIRHYDELPTEDEDLSPKTQGFLVLKKSYAFGHWRLLTLLISGFLDPEYWGRGHSVRDPYNSY